MILFLKLIFYVSIVFLIILSLFPGSLIGYFFYGDLGQQPNLIKNPYGADINHFFAYLYVSLLGFSLYLKNKNFHKLVYILFFLSITLEALQFVIPKRSFQLVDLLFNILAVIVAYSVVKIYLLINKS